MIKIKEVIKTFNSGTLKENEIVYHKLIWQKQQ